MPNNTNDSMPICGPDDQPKTFGLQIDQMFERMHAAYEGAGDPHAVLDALQLAFETGRTNQLPDWALAAAIKIVASVVKRGTHLGKGQNGNTAARHQRN